MLEMEEIPVDQMDTLKLHVPPKGSTTPLQVVAPVEDEPDLDPYALWDEEARLNFAELCTYLHLPAFQVEHLEVMLRIVVGVAGGSYLHSPCKCWMHYHADVWAAQEKHLPTCLYYQAQQLVASLEGAA